MARTPAGSQCLVGQVWLQPRSEVATDPSARAWRVRWSTLDRSGVRGGRWPAGR